MKAADRFHCPPWALLEKGRPWVEMALAAVSAENGAANERQRMAEARARAQRKFGGSR